MFKAVRLSIRNKAKQTHELIVMTDYLSAGWGSRAHQEMGPRQLVLMLPLRDVLWGHLQGWHDLQHADDLQQDHGHHQGLKPLNG